MDDEYYEEDSKKQESIKNEKVKDNIKELEKLLEVEKLKLKQIQRSKSPNKLIKKQKYLHQQNNCQ
jgi:hypothetical protein